MTRPAIRPGEPVAATFRPLSPRRRRFVDAYARNGNGTRAAISAGYAPQSARVTACRLLTNANVAAEIDVLRRRRLTALDLEVQGLVREFARVAFSRVCPLDYQVVEPDQPPALRPAEEWTAEMRMMCAGVKATRTRVRIVLRDRDRALRMLTRYAGGFVH